MWWQESVLSLILIVFVLVPQFYNFMFVGAYIDYFWFDNFKREIYGYQKFNKCFLFFIFNYSLLIININHRRIIFELFIVFIIMLFVQVSYKLIIFSSLIIRTKIIFIGITFVIYLMSKIWRCFMMTIFFYIWYSILFWYFSRVDCIFNMFLSYNRTVWCFI